MAILVIAELDVLPENALELMTKKPIPCCDGPDVQIDPRDRSLLMTCRACHVQVRVVRTQPQLRGSNPLKNRQAILKAMAADLDALAERWNYRIITGQQMKD